MIRKFPAIPVVIVSYFAYHRDRVTSNEQREYTEERTKNPLTSRPLSGDAYTCVARDVWRKEIKTRKKKRDTHKTMNHHD